MHPIWIALGGLAATSTVYAALLSTSLGRRWATAQTWVTVIIGTLLVLAWLAVFDWQTALLTLLFFVVGGAPIVIRSLVFEFRERESVQKLAGGR